MMTLQGVEDSAYGAFAKGVKTDQRGTEEGRSGDGGGTEEGRRRDADVFGSRYNCQMVFIYGKDS